MPLPSLLCEVHAPYISFLVFDSTLGRLKITKLLSVKFSLVSSYYLAVTLLKTTEVLSVQE
jgi:hypothetical protein